MVSTEFAAGHCKTSFALASSLNAPYGAPPWEGSDDWAADLVGENSVSVHSPAAAPTNETYSAHSVAGSQFDGSEADDSGLDSPGLYGSEDGCRSAAPPWDGSESALRFRAPELSNSGYSWFHAGCFPRTFRSSREA